MSTALLVKSAGSCTSGSSPSSSSFSFPSSSTSPSQFLQNCSSSTKSAFSWSPMFNNTQDWSKTLQFEHRAPSDRAHRVHQKGSDSASNRSDRVQAMSILANSGVAASAMDDGVLVEEENHQELPQMDEKYKKVSHRLLTPEKARLLRQSLLESETWHDTMYHSAIASRLASPNITQNF